MRTELRTKGYACGAKNFSPPIGPHLLTLIFLLLTLACRPAHAQSAGSSQNVGQNLDDTETVRVETELVDLNVSVFAQDRARAVGQLGQKDFLVFENGVPEEIAFFASASAPFDLVLLLDLSGSTADKLDLVRKSARRFVEAARPEDRIAVVTFTDAPRVVSGLTSDRKELINRIKKIEKPKGGTNFWDSLSFVLTSLMNQPGSSRRGAVIAMTDGVDNALPDVPGEGSRKSFEELLEIIRRSGTIVLPIYLDTEEEMVMQGRANRQAYFIARQQLFIIAEESGGNIYRAARVEDLKGVYEQVIRDLSTVYSIGYRPANRVRDGSWRTVAVRLAGRPDLAARTKRGYYAK